MKYILYVVIGITVIINIPILLKILHFTGKSTPYDSFVQQFFDHEAVLDFDQQYAMFTEEKKKEIGSLEHFSRNMIQMIKQMRQETGGKKAIVSRVEIGRESGEEVELTAFIERGDKEENYLFLLRKEMETWKVAKLEHMHVVDFASIKVSKAQASYEETEEADDGTASKKDKDQSKKDEEEPETVILEDNGEEEDYSHGVQNFSKEKVVKGQESRREPVRKGGKGSIAGAKQVLQGVLDDAEVTGVISKKEHTDKTTKLKSLQKPA